MSGDITDTRVQAAKALLGGQGRIAAKAQDLPPVTATGPTPSTPPKPR